MSTRRLEDELDAYRPGDCERSHLIRTCLQRLRRNAELRRFDNVHTRDEWRDHLAVRRLDSDLVTYVREHLRMTERHERKFTKVGVSREVFEGMQLSGYHTGE